MRLVASSLDGRSIWHRRIKVCRWSYSERRYARPGRRPGRALGM